MGKKSRSSQKDIHRHSKHGSVSGPVHTHFLHSLPDARPFAPPLHSRPSTQALVITEPLHLAIVDSRNPPVALRTCPPSITPTYLLYSRIGPSHAAPNPYLEGSLSPAAQLAHLITNYPQLTHMLTFHFRQFSSILAKSTSPSPLTFCFHPYLHLHPLCRQEA